MLPSQLFAPRNSAFYNNPWTAVSDPIPFKSTRPGIGAGEDKVAAEFGTTAQGQNSAWDLVNFNFGGTLYPRGDVKKLDTDGSFNTGKNGRKAYRDFETKINDLFSRFRRSGLESLRELGNRDTGELCESTLKAIVDNCTRLVTLRRDLESTLPIVKPMIDPYSGNEVPMTAQSLYAFYMQNKIDLPDILSPHHEPLRMLEVLDHEYIRDPTKMMDDLTSLTGVFEGVVLVFVSETHGYHVTTDPVNAIRFLRITKGCPRFRVLEQ